MSIFSTIYHCFYIVKSKFSNFGSTYITSRFMEGYLQMQTIFLGSSQLILGIPQWSWCNLHVPEPSVPLWWRHLCQLLQILNYNSPLIYAYQNDQLWRPHWQYDHFCAKKGSPYTLNSCLCEWMNHMTQITLFLKLMIIWSKKNQLVSHNA